MVAKWSPKECMECMKTLTSPYEEGKKAQGTMSGIFEKIKEIASRNKGVLK